MDYNDFIWNRLLDRKKVDKKLRNGFRFHHEIATDGVCVSILYSRPDPSGKGNKIKKMAVFTPECKQKLFFPGITIRYLKTLV